MNDLKNCVDIYTEKTSVAFDDGLYQGSKQFFLRELPVNLLPMKAGLKRATVTRSMANLRTQRSDSVDVMVELDDSSIKGRDIKRRTKLKHKPSKLDLLDNRQLTSFPQMSSPRHSVTSKRSCESIVLVEDYFYDDDGRSCRTVSADSSTGTRNKEALTCDLGDIKSSRIPHSPLSSHSHSPRSPHAVSDEPASPYLKHCIKCGKFLPGTSVHSVSDRYSLFVCSDCRHSYSPPSRTLRQKRSMQVLPPQRQNEWYDTVRHKLRWRWRITGLLPKSM